MLLNRGTWFPSGNPLVPEYHSIRCRRKVLDRQNHPSLFYPSVRENAGRSLNNLGHSKLAKSIREKYFVTPRKNHKLAGFRRIHHFSALISVYFSMRKWLLGMYSRFFLIRALLVAALNLSDQDSVGPIRLNITAHPPSA